MRIIGGTHRGRRLASLGKGDEAAQLRPTSDRVRESLFNILRSYGAPEGMRVLDLFAGTGALGLEALSRGASALTCVENGRTALGLLRENIALFEDDITLLAKDVSALGAGTPHDLVFADPPYGKSLGEQALQSAIAGGWLAADALVVWEENAQIRPPAGLRLRDERRYGETFMRIFTLD